MLAAIYKDATSKPAIISPTSELRKNNNNWIKRQRPRVVQFSAVLRALWDILDAQMCEGRGTTEDGMGKTMDDKEQDIQSFITTGVLGSEWVNSRKHWQTTNKKKKKGFVSVSFSL